MFPPCAILEAMISHDPEVFSRRPRIIQSNLYLAKSNKKKINPSDWVSMRITRVDLI